MTTRVSLIRYTPEMQSEWDEFVRGSVNGTMLSTMRFLSYHPPDRFIDHSLIATRGDRWIAALPASEQQVGGRKELNSHPGCTYGGLLLAPSVGTARVREIIEAIISHTRDLSFNRIAISPPPDVYHRVPCQHIDFAFRRMGFQYYVTGLSTCVPLEGYTEEDLQRHMSSNCRRGIRRAERDGVEVRETDDFETYWEILTENLRAHGVSPVHTVQEIRVLRERFTERIRLFCAFLSGEMVAGSVLFVATQKTAHTQYLASRAEYQVHQPMNLLIWGIMKWAREHEFRYLNFGVSTESDGEIVNWGLLRFKESFGGTGVVHTRYTLDLRE